MKLLTLIFLFIFSVACEQSNTTKNNPKILFDSAAYLTINHYDKQSLLRQKLLNIQLTKMLNKENETKIYSGDELKFSTEDFLMNESEKKEYQKLESLSAKIIVSTHDRLEIYFVPDGISRESALRQLSFKSMPNNQYFWSKELPTILAKGQSYYLVYANVMDIKKNDGFFYNEIKNLKDFKTQDFTFKNHQTILLDFKIDYLLKQVGTVVKAGRSPSRCTRDMFEAGVCGGCTYEIEQWNGQYSKKHWVLDDLENVIVINGKKITWNEVTIVSMGNDHLIVSLNLNELSEEETVHLRILNFMAPGLTQIFQGRNFGYSCLGTYPPVTEDLTPEIRFDLEMQIKGRELSF